MEIPTLREETCKRKVAFFRSMMAKAELLSGGERAQLLEEMRTFADSLNPANMVLTTSAMGLGAAFLPVIGLITGPVIGGAYGAYKSHKLAHYRQEVLSMIRYLSL